MHDYPTISSEIVAGTGNRDLMVIVYVVIIVIVVIKKVNRANRDNIRDNRASN